VSQRLPLSQCLSSHAQFRQGFAGLLGLCFRGAQGEFRQFATDFGGGELQFFHKLADAPDFGVIYAEAGLLLTSHREIAEEIPERAEGFVGGRSEVVDQAGLNVDVARVVNGAVERGEFFEGFFQAATHSWRGEGKLPLHKFAESRREIVLAGEVKGFGKPPVSEQTGEFLRGRLEGGGHRPDENDHQQAGNGEPEQHWLNDGHGCEGASDRKHPEHPGEGIPKNPEGSGQVATPGAGHGRENESGFW